MSNIEWTDVTWNPVSGCTRASEGCDHCYAVRMSYRLEKMGQKKYTGLTVLNGKGDRQFNGVVRCNQREVSTPLGWKAKGRRCFVNSMSDTFHKDVPFDFIDQMFAAMTWARDTTFQVLTKRPDRMAEYFADPNVRERIKAAMAQVLIQWGGPVLGGRFNEPFLARHQHVIDELASAWPLPNVWLGTSTENQARADERVPHLLQCPAAVRFLSVEPMIGAVSLARWLAPFGCTGCGWRGYLGELDSDGDETAHEETRMADLWCPQCKGTSGASLVTKEWHAGRLGWVICGGESGKGARPFDPQDALILRRECEAAGVPFFFKQMGAKPFDKFNDVPVKVLDPKGHNWEGTNWEVLRVHEFPTVKNNA